MVRRLLLTALVSVTASAGLVAVPTAAHAADYSAPLTQAIADLPTATETCAGYSRDLIHHWIDADGDGCDTRDEVLISEAEEAPSVGSGCAISTIAVTLAR